MTQGDLEAIDTEALRQAHLAKLRAEPERLDEMPAEWIVVLCASGDDLFCQQYRRFGREVALGRSGAWLTRAELTAALERAERTRTDRVS